MQDFIPHYSSLITHTRINHFVSHEEIFLSRHNPTQVDKIQGDNLFVRIL